jgi:DNA gyrase subunit B
MIKKNKKTEYKAKDIHVLEGLEPVRKRPGMYIGSTGKDGLHHLIYECCDNCIDEFIMGHGDRMEVTLLPNNRVEVADNGRGIPVDVHPQTKKSALETVMTHLHAGGKFGGKVYKATGGLHGVGISVVCALSKWMKAEVCRDGQQYEQEYAKGRPITKIKKVGKCKGRGTKITFEADPEIFKEIEFSWKKILKHLREQAYLVPGLKVVLQDKRKKPYKKYVFYFEGGLKSLLAYLMNGKRRIQENIFYVQKEVEDAKVEVAFCYTDDIETKEVCYANNIPTPEGGSHLTGFRSALTRALQSWGKQQKLLNEKEKIEGEDVREGLTAIVSIKIPDPQFEGQTKQKLGNPEARSAVESVVCDILPDFLERNPRDGRSIIGKCLLASKSRKAAKAAKESVIRKGIMDGLTLPGKLTDCSSRDPEESEIFIVEGESAGGSSRQGRDRRFQAILPLRGKILNVERVHLNKILASKEVKSLIIALGTAVADDFDISKLRYHKIVIMTDADTDGAHIRTLLLTLFYRYFRAIIDGGYLYIAQPPLYRIQVGKEIKYAYTEKEKETIVGSLKNRPFSIQRYKGLGEMNPDQLWETTMDPEKRVLKQVNIEDAQDADRIFDILMGKEVLPRKKFIQTYAKEVRNLDI